MVTCGDMHGQEKAGYRALVRALERTSLERTGYGAY